MLSEIEIILLPSDIYGLYTFSWGLHWIEPLIKCEKKSSEKIFLLCSNHNENEFNTHEVWY